MRWLSLVLALVVFFVSVFVSGFASRPAFAAGALTVDGRFFRDSSGGVVLLRGADVGGNSKVPPFKAIGPLTQLDPLATWGMNVVRLLFTWEAYEGQQGVYDDAGYLAYYIGLVHGAGQRGIYVIVDFHQDAFSRYSLQGCGEGFPQWALPSTVTPAVPDNGADCADWGTRQVGDPDITTTWNAFYAAGSPARAAYLTMIARVATALAGESAVIGYDLLNEPLGDEQTQIAPLYADAVAAIRAVDSKAIAFVSPNGITSAGTATKLPQPTFGNFAYAPHFYDPIVQVTKSWNDSDESIGFGNMISVSTAWNVPLFLGEFGAPPDVDGLDGYMGAIHTQLNSALASGTQWAYTPGWTPTAKDGWNAEDFSIVDDSGAIRANFRPRPFPRRVGGTPTLLSVSNETLPKQNALQLTWDNDPAAGVTELYLPAAYFGGKVSVDGDGDVKCKRDGDLAQCTAASKGTKSVRAAYPSSRCGLTGAEALAFLALVRRRRRQRSRMR
jgi:endoglycosylceramidase